MKGCSSFHLHRDEIFKNKTQNPSIVNQPLYSMGEINQLLKAKKEYKYVIPLLNFEL